MLDPLRASLPPLTTMFPLLPMLLVSENSTSPSKIAVWLFRLNANPGVLAVWLNRIAAPLAAVTVSGLTR